MGPIIWNYFVEDCLESIIFSKLKWNRSYRTLITKEVVFNTLNFFGKIASLTAPQTRLLLGLRDRCQFRWLSVSTYFITETAFYVILLPMVILYSFCNFTYTWSLERKANIKIEHHATLPNIKEMIKNIHLNKKIYKIYQNIFRM